MGTTGAPITGFLHANLPTHLYVVRIEVGTTPSVHLAGGVWEGGAGGLLLFPSATLPLTF